jgi:hypothetical protein
MGTKSAQRFRSPFVAAGFLLSVVSPQALVSTLTQMIFQ